MKIYACRIEINDSMMNRTPNSTAKKGEAAGNRVEK